MNKMKMNNTSKSNKATFYVELTHQMPPPPPLAKDVQ